MSSEEQGRAAAIRVSNLRKVFKVYARPMDLARELLTGKVSHSEFCSLRDVSFEVGQGEVVGIIGHNGAGKSTLLRIIAGTLEQTDGVIETRGRVTAILELGTGFHPQYSGRENVYMGGLCLGLSRDEIRARFDEIVAFSELEEVIDQPFRTYSTGMQARLTFATALSVDPEILIIDEALSVGDAKFQQKSFRKLAEFRERGKTVLLVSHDINTVVAFCDRVIMLQKGEVGAAGDPKAVAQFYHRSLFGTGGEVGVAPASAMAGSGSADAGRESAGRYGDGSVRIEGFQLEDEAGHDLVAVESGSSCCFVFTVLAAESIADASFGLVIRTSKGVDLFGVTNLSKNYLLGDLRAGERYVFRCAMRMWLASGHYFVTFGVARGHGAKCDFLEDGLHFRVVGPPGLFSASVVNLEPVLGVTTADGEKLPDRREAR